jgi:hypothetical protein
METETKIKEVVPDFTEMSSTEDGPIGRVLSATYVKTQNGPLEKEEVGRIGRFAKDTFRALFFSNRVSLLELEGEKTYRCIRKFQFVNSKGEYEIIEPKTELLLNEQEAAKYIKEGAVLPAFDTTLWGKHYENS